MPPAKTISFPSNAPASITSRIVFPARDTNPHIVQNVPLNSAKHVIVDGLDVCFWLPQPSIYPLLILLNELAKKGRGFLCVLDANFTSQIRRFTGEEAFKKIIREIYDPALVEFPDRFVEIKTDSIAHILAESEKRGSPIISMDKELRARYQKQPPSQPVEIISGQVKKVGRGIATVEVPALGISARGFAKEPIQLWWALRDLLKPRPKPADQPKPPLGKKPLPPINPGGKKPLWGDDIPTIKVYWKILGAAPTTQRFTKIIEYYENLRKKRVDVIYDIGRLQQVYDLKPDAIYLGLDEFEGYIVFHFQSKQLAVLECPEVGNAMYLIAGKWEKLSRQNRSDLLERYPNRVTRLIHRGDWLVRLKERLSA